MAVTPERYHFQPSRKICLSSILLCQLLWILPCALLLLVHTSAPQMLIVQDRNTTKRISTLGFSFPVKVLGEHDLLLLRKICKDWHGFWVELKKNLVSKGFVQPRESSCFIWLPECYLLVKNERIMHIVKEVVGPSVLLYGMTAWEGENEVLNRFHRDEAVMGCEKSVNFLYGTSVQLVSQSNKLSEGLLKAVLRNLLSVEQESFKAPNKQEQLAYLEKLFAARVSKMVRSPKLWLESLELEDGFGVFFHGGTLYRVGEVLGSGRGLLMQFVSADCKVRESQNAGWGAQGTSYSLYMPPVLLVAGDHKALGATNDVRLTLAKEEDLQSKLAGEKVLAASLVGGVGKKEPMQVHNVTVFSESMRNVGWQDEGMWRFRRVGEASTRVMAVGSIEHVVPGQEFLAMDFGTIAGDGDQVIVVVSEGMLYFRAIKENDTRHCELMELRPGSAVLLSKNLLHALVPLSHDVGFMSFHWSGQQKGTAQQKLSAGDVSQNDRSGIESLLNRELLAHGFTQATEGRTISLGSGQAYDPDNNEYCDVIVFMVEGYLLQVLPSNDILQALDVLVIPASQTCVLWNVGNMPVKLFAMHLCHLEEATQLMTTVGASGKVF